MTVVRMARTLGGDWPPAGDTIDIPAPRAKALIAAGHAKAVRTRTKTEDE